MVTLNGCVCHVEGTPSGVTDSGAVFRLVSVGGLICMNPSPFPPLAPGARPGSDSKRITAGIGIFVARSLMEVVGYVAPNESRVASICSGEFHSRLNLYEKRVDSSTSILGSGSGRSSICLYGSDRRTFSPALV